MIKIPQLPKTATAPFCPSEVQGTIHLPDNANLFKRILSFAGPGLLVAVGYMDPGNWATDIVAGSRYGYSLLFVVLLSSLAAIVLQCLSMRVGLIAGRDLAQLSRAQYDRKTNLLMWFLAELAIIATDVAEVLGSALAFKLLFGCSLQVGIGITALDTLIVLGLKGKGFRQVEAIILGLVATIGICFFTELLLIQPHWPDVAWGLVPFSSRLEGVEPWYLAVGIIGATVMPHNLYLHSSIVQTRAVANNFASRAQALKFSTFDTIASLTLAFFVNASILVLSGAAFYANGHQNVTGIDEAYRLLDPIVGSSLAGVLFGVALLAAGQSSTFTGTIAGQIIMEGFLDLKIPCWQRRLLTRALALIPAYIGVSLWGEHSVSRLLVLSQVVLSMQLPFAIFPLIRFASNRKLMNEFRIGSLLQTLAWGLFSLICGANVWLVWQMMTGS